MLSSKVAIGKLPGLLFNDSRWSKTVSIKLKKLLSFSGQTSILEKSSVSIISKS